MKMQKSLWVALCCVAVLGLATGCSDDDSSVCGDGVATGNEDCDLNDLRGMTCADLPDENFTAGTLGCTSTCTYNTSACSVGIVCGNGIPEFGEICDCGSDSGNLPATCTDVNGGANANCDTTCHRIDMCGDGVVSGTEECDCGNPSMIANVPTGCTDYNGALNSNCDDSCGAIVECLYDLFDECFPLQGDPPEHGCCEDDAGVQLECKTSILQGMDNMCARTCTTAADCNWNNACFGTEIGNPGYDLCFYSQCGPGDVVDAQIFGVCQAQGANPGLCIPFGRYTQSHEFYGFCFEPGNIAHGDPCPTSNANPPVYLLDTDRDADGGAADKMCDTGLCLSTQGAIEGICAQFCNWYEEYDHIFYGATASSLACPAGDNCWAEATISQNDVSPINDYGYRSGDLGYCRPTLANDATYGLTACSLVTGQLLTNTALTCADSHTDGRCVLAQYSTEYLDANNNPVAGSEVTHGSLIGMCVDGAATTVNNVWDPCDPATDVCPLGSLCMEQDIFGAATGTTRCIPYCDTAHHSGNPQTCVDLGTPATTADGTPVCTSVSYTYGTGGAADPSKSRLGYCALPRP